MLSGDYPYIRDRVTINSDLQTFCNRPGDGPVFILGRTVEHAPGFDLRLTGRPLIIVADVYDGTNGMINARGADGVGGGAAGANGVHPWPDTVNDASGEDHPVGPGGSGQGGGRGSDGSAGGSVTVMCRRSINAHISVAGGSATSGGPGGNGARGVDGHITPDKTIFVVDDKFAEPPTGHEEFVAGQTISGTPGGDGGAGGAGGNGGNGGTISFTSIVDDTPPVLEAGGGGAGAGGPGGAPGEDGRLSDVMAVEGSFGTDGLPGSDGQVTFTNVAEADYPAGLRPLLDSTGPSYANYWAPFRIITGEYFYHQYNPSIPERADNAARAAVEFERALELQPDNVEAQRLAQQLGGGTNALGLPRDLDVLPSFDEYNTAFTSFGTPVLAFLGLGVNTILTRKTLADLAEFVEQQRRQAAGARDDTVGDLDIAKAEQKLAGDEVEYAQQQLDQATADIQKALVEMQHQGSPSMSFGDIIGTVAEVGAAVVSIAAAVPTAGTSLVALVPAMVALADSVTDNAAPIAKAVFSGTKADTKAVEDAYKAVDKDASAVIKGAKSIVNFVNVVQKLGQAATPDNSKYLALVRRGTEQTHQLLIARNRAAIAQQRVDAKQAAVNRADDVVHQAQALSDELHLDAASIKRAGLLAVATAQSKTNALLGFAFRAQRSVEIYTLQNEEHRLVLDAGLVSPDVSQSYYEEDIDEGQLVSELVSSWSSVLGPLDIQADYLSYFDQPHDQDTLRRSFTAADPHLDDLKTRHQFSVRIDATELPAGHADAKIKSVRLALIGATHPAGEISCEVRHGGTYEQRRRDGTITTQLLSPRVSTRPAKTTALVPDEGLGDDPPLTAPRSLAYWGRGVGGDWQVSIPPEQFTSGLDLSGLTEVQLWIGYQFLR